MDELAVFTAAHNLAQHGRADINQLIWTNHWTPNPPGIWGNDGNLYTKKPPGISFITAPLIGLGNVIPGLNSVHVGLLTNAVVTALIASLLLIWLVDLGFSWPVATLTSLGYGLGTFAWVYARMFWASSLLALALLVAVWSLYRAVYLAQGQRRWLWLLLCGVAVAIGLTLRFEAALIIVFIGLYLIARQRWNDSATSQTRGSTNDESAPTTHYALSRAHSASGFTFHISALIGSFAIFLAPSLIAGLALLYFNFSRYGSLIETGYTQEILFRKPWAGAYGLLLSPGSGLFIYAPVTLLLFFGLRPAWHRLPRHYFWLIAAVCLCYWVFYGSWFAWGGAWGWGPRFLLSILPLLMLFVAEPVEWLCSQEERGLKSMLAWLGVGILAVLSLIINFLGITVDFNEYFLRLGSIEDFVFSWAAFPPPAHWRILQEGLVDLIWIRPQSEGLKIEWSVLLPALALLISATVNLIITYRGRKGTANASLGNSILATNRIAPNTSRSAFRAFALLAAIGLTFLMMRGTSRIPLTNQQASLDTPLLDTLAASAQRGDALLVSMPPFGDLQEISTLLMAYLEQPLPTYVWIESEPRAIEPDERARLQQAVQAEAQRVWLFERWLTQVEPTTVSAAHLNQTGFSVWESWFTESGKLTLYTLIDTSQPSPPVVPLNIPFQGGLNLVNFAVWNDELTVKPGDIVKLRLTWQVTSVSGQIPQDIPVGGIVASAQLLHQADPVRNIAHRDRLLIDLQNFGQSPLQPGQAVQQGYGLQLSDDLAPGSYPLIVGLYHSTTGQRLLRADGSPDDFVYLTNIEIK